MTDDIEIIGASENNLKHIDLTIPKGKLVVFAGVSGSGKSSLAFDTVAVESSRAPPNPPGQPHRSASLSHTTGFLNRIHL